MSYYLIIMTFKYGSCSVDKNKREFHQHLSHGIIEQWRCGEYFIFFLTIDCLSQSTAIYDINAILIWCITYTLPIQYILYPPTMRRINYTFQRILQSGDIIDPTYMVDTLIQGTMPGNLSHSKGWDHTVPLFKINRIHTVHHVKAQQTIRSNKQS